MKPEKDVIQQWLDSVNNEGKNLTAWELQFMESITDFYDRRGFLSEKQQEILERIYTEKVK